MALNKSAVVDTALDLLREAGLPGMSMRTLATRLHVQASALYWHFPSKQALLTAVAERVLASVAPVEAGGTGVEGAGVGGTGVDGTGIDGSGVDGSGVNGTGVDSSAAEELRAVGRALKVAVTEVPDGAEIVALGLAAGAVNPVARAVEATCARHGLDGRAAGLTTAMTAYVLGLTLEEQTHHNLAAADPAMPGVEFAPRFEEGLEALLAGY